MTADVFDDSSKTAPTRGRSSAAKSWLKAIELTSRIEAHPQRLFADIVEDWAKRPGDHPALISDTETLTYRALSARINQYARWALGAGIKPGDRVRLRMPSRPDYIAAWLGISLVGGVVALINTKLVGRSLAHCINVAKAAHAIVADEFTDAYDASCSHLIDAPRRWLHGDGAEISAALAAMDPSRLSAAERRGITIDDRALLIYTSGTTGLPKAASISHRRILNWGGWFAGLTGASPEDRLKVRKIARFTESGPFTNDAERSPAGGPVWHVSGYHREKRCNEKASAHVGQVDDHFGHEADRGRARGHPAAAS
jgi:fatty-acyl-CoA synthase